MAKPLPISGQLRQAIVDSELTRYRIAKETGLSQSLLSRFVRGERGLSLDAVDKLGALLGLTITKLDAGKRKARRSP